MQTKTCSEHILRSMRNHLADKKKVVQPARLGSECTHLTVAQQGEIKVILEAYFKPIVVSLVTHYLKCVRVYVCVY